MSPNNNAPGPILVVEDHPPLQQSYQEILELAGYAVLLAGSAQEGLQILQEVETTPRLIITDLVMPGMGGLAFFRQVRAQVQWQHIPFIFVSGSHEKLTEIQNAAAPEQITCLLKPFVIQELLDVIAKHL